MHVEELTHGIRCVPGRPAGVGALVLAGSSGRVDEERARLLGHVGVTAEAVRWFGGPGQQPGPWEVPLETFARRVDSLRADCDRVVLVGTSFGAEAALATVARTGVGDAVVAFAPTDVVWAGADAGGRQTSHWTLDGEPLPFVPLDPGWTPGEDPPAYADLYARSLAGADAGTRAAATIPVEQVPELLAVAGGDDRVWPSAEAAERIRARRAEHGLATTLVTDGSAGHRTVLPGEEPVTAGPSMRRGGTLEADGRLGEAAWEAMVRLLHGAAWE